ncbi:STAS domain-containing protein [Nibribacter ruber]|uniref:STAS domain-containing protein n=1 Tax=Nibribacter ruber TaxID=2698458 RepID=A0A6P1P4D6_9BACT|nr:STAS domain-containing protein [Nibribacter ruber]QHL89215.1 STAS domain-containing protein [Nibribacter ruber]
MESRSDKNVQATLLAGHTPLIILQGCLDEAYATLLINSLDKSSPWQASFILVDFGKVTQVTPAGLRHLLPLISQLQDQKKELVLFNLRTDIKQTVCSSGFDSLVMITPTLQDAILYAQQPKNTNKGLAR